MGRLLALTILLAGALSTSQTKAEQVEQTSLLLSLMQVQDRIADGDSAAMPLQKQLMKMINASIAESGGKKSLSTSEIRVLLTFGIISNSSRVVTTALHEIKTPEEKVGLARAVIDYRTRKGNQAARRFAEIDIFKLDGRLAPFVAFAKGNLLSRRSPQNAIVQYDLVRLIAPGTLLEEVTLRRLMALYASQNNGAKFVAISKQYARRFISSPYRQQYISMLRSGIVSMRRSISLKRVEELSDLMPPAFATAFHMHLVRSALQKGYFKLARFSLEEFLKIPKTRNNKNLNKTQIQLLKLLSGMNVVEPQDIAKKLADLDTTKLNDRDLEMYQTARNVLASVLSPIDEIKTNTVKRDVENKLQNEIPMEQTVSTEVSSTQRQLDNTKVSNELDDVELLISKTEMRLKAIDDILDE